MVQYTKIDHIDFEARADNDSDEELVFSENLNDDSIQKEEEDDSPRFYRFVNQTRDVSEALNDDDKSKLDVCDLQSEMFYDIKREFVEFDEFDGYQKPSSKFKEILCSFQGDLKDSFLMLFCTGFFLSFQRIIKLIKKRQRRFLARKFLITLKNTRHVMAGSFN